MKVGVTTAALLLLLILPATALAQPIISIESAQYTQQPPFTFKLPVYISNAKNVTGINFNLTFNPTVIKVRNVESKEGLKLWGTNWDNKTGYLNVALVAEEEPITTDEPMQIVEIEFEAVDYGHTSLNFTFAEVSLLDFNPVTCITENGSVLILLPIKPKKLTCAGICHAKYVELKTDFVPNVPISFNQSNVILGIFKEYNALMPWTIPNPVIELFYNTSELYPPHTKGAGSFDRYDPIPTTVNNVTGYIRWDLPSVTANYSAAVARAFDDANFGLIVDKPEMWIFRHSQDVITANGTYWTNITVNATDCFRVKIVVKLMNNSYMDANVVSWVNVTPPGVNARVDRIDDKTLVAIFERYGSGWNPTNGTIMLNVSYDITKFTGNIIFYKPEVKVVIRKRVSSDWLNGIIYNDSYNVSLRSVLFDRWVNFSSSSKLNWTTEEFDLRVVKLKGYFNVSEEEGKPDLVIIGKDEINAQGGYKVQYIIKNIGNATAPPGHKTALIVDGKLIETKAVPIPLPPGAMFTDIFNTTIPFTSPPNDTITVVADYYDDVDELNESNNKKTNVYEYPLMMADSLGVEDASGYPGTYVEVPVNITNAKNGSIVTIEFRVEYNESVIKLVGATTGDLTANWGFSLMEGNKIRMTQLLSPGLPIQNGASGTVAILNFSVVGNYGDVSPINITDIYLMNNIGDVGTAPPKNGIFKVWLKGDLNGNGQVADIWDLSLMVKAYLGQITPDSKYDLNENGQAADIWDLSLMVKAYLGQIEL